MTCDLAIEQRTAVMPREMGRKRRGEKKSKTMLDGRPFCLPQSTSIARHFDTIYFEYQYDDTCTVIFVPILTEATVLAPDVGCADSADDGPVQMEILQGEIKPDPGSDSCGNAPGLAFLDIQGDTMDSEPECSLVDTATAEEDDDNGLMENTQSVETVLKKPAKPKKRSPKTKRGSTKMKKKTSQTKKISSKATSKRSNMT